MLALTLKKHPGRLLWRSTEVLDQIASLPALWGQATGTFRHVGRRPLRLIATSDGTDLQAEGMSIHGRSCHLGKGPDGRYYFAKGTGWIHFPGWEPDHGSYGILPRRTAERERDLAIRLASLGTRVVRPEAIIAHLEIPDARGGPSRQPDEVIDLDGQPAWPCVYIYSSASRWRLADLTYLSKRQRRCIWRTGRHRRTRLKEVIEGLGRQSARLHAEGGHDYALSAHNVFCDGTRVDFEQACLPEMPHPDPVLNKTPEMWQGRELDGLRTLTWEIAELLRIDVSLSEATGWWEQAYQSTRREITECPLTGESTAPIP